MGRFFSFRLKGNTGPPLIFAAGLISLALAVPVAGENRCEACHEEVVRAYEPTPHAQLVRTSDRFCQVCHKVPDQHVESGEVAGLRQGAEINQWSAGEQASACLSCHGASMPAYRSSPHAAEKLCWDCHSGQALHWKQSSGKEQQMVLCTSCHPQVGSQFRQAYHHPVPEKLMKCTSCHDIHGSRSLETNAAGSCASCHLGQSGPYLFSHPAMWEGCQTCHTPHGSSQRGLLRTRGNGLCLSCHTQSNFPGVGKANHDFFLRGGGRCWDCHSQVHGSNTTPDFNPRGRR